MTQVAPRLPKLTLNRPFVQDFMAQEAPCFALGMVEERGRPFAVLALRPGVSIPPDILERGFNLGHSWLATAHFEVIHFAFEFPGFETFNVLLNPNNALVQTVVGSMVEQGGYFILAIDPDQRITAFRTDFGQQDGIGLKDNIVRMQRSTTTAAQYGQTL